MTLDIRPVQLICFKEQFVAITDNLPAEFKVIGGIILELLNALNLIQDSMDDGT